MSSLFQANFTINTVYPDTSAPNYHWGAAISFNGPASYGFDGNDVAVGDYIYANSGFPTIAQTSQFRVTSIVSQDATNVDLWATYDDNATAPNVVSAGSYLITKPFSNGLASDPSSLWCLVNENMSAYASAKNSEKIKFPNNILQGASGFAAHELDGSNNDVNSFIEWNDTDQTHYHRVNPQQNGQDLDIKISFQFPSHFTGVRETADGNALEFYAKADDGSTSGVNYAELVALVDTDGTEFPVTGKQVSSTGRSLITMSKTEIESVLNPVTSSSSSSSYRTWDSGDAGLVVYARFKLFGDNGDNIYLDQDNAFMYIL